MERDGDIIILKHGDERWPAGLDNLANPPEVLFCKGNLELLKKPIVAIVGTRDCTRYGVEVAKKLANQLATLGIVTVSGLADGIDTAAHTGAGAENTIAVLGNGVNQFFPAANVDLQKRIANDGGLLVSEYPPSAKCNRYTFPQRNRIIAALSKTVIVVEADNKSGALITKEFALDLGLEVFAVPGPINSPASRGTNEMIKTAACACLTEISDVLSVFGMTFTSKENTVTQISFEARIVLNVLRHDELHFDELVTKTNFVPKILTTLLTTMEMDGIIQKLPGNHYVSKLG